jgi:hypothetical protein
MMSEVYVVTNTELGWDCVVAVFNADSVSASSLEDVFKGDGGYVVHSVKEVEKDCFDYQEEA